LELEWDFSELLKGLDQYEAHVKAALIEAAREVAMDFWGRAMSKAPVLTGHLRGTHTAHVNGEVFISGDAGANNSDLAHDKNAAAIVVGANTEYAAKRHETNRAGSKGGEGKWIEKTVNERGKIWMKLLADAVKNAKGGR